MRQVFEVSGWDLIPVPANWELHGYGVPIYLKHSLSVLPRIRLIFRAKTIRSGATSAASRFRRIGSDGAWSCVSERLPAACESGSNGEELGYNQGSKTPVEFDVSGIVSPGEKRGLQCRFQRWTDGFLLGRAGLFGGSLAFNVSVSIYSTPKTHIADFSWVTQLDEDFSDAVASIDVLVEGEETSIGFRPCCSTARSTSGRSSSGGERGSGIACLRIDSPENSGARRHLGCTTS